MIDWLSAFSYMGSIMLFIIYFFAALFLFLDAVEKYQWSMWFGFWVAIFLFFVVNAMYWGNDVARWLS